MSDFDEIELEFNPDMIAVAEIPAEGEVQIDPQSVGIKEEPGQMPTSFLSYLASTREAEYQRMYDFALDTLQFANKVQVYHWTCEKGFYHTQFEEIYDLLRDFADKLVETCLAYTKGKFTFNSKNYAQSPADFNIDSAIMKLIEFREAAEGTSKGLEMNRSLTNIFDDMLAELDKHIGLLRNFS